MKKRVFVFIFLTVISFIFIFSQTKENKCKRVYLIYMNGSDLESDFASASIDIKEIVSAKTGEDFKIYVYTGGSEKWHTECINPKYNEVFEVKENSLKKIKSFDSANMDKADTLSDFVDYVYTLEGESQYNIILWNHGGNALSGSGKDENHSSDSLITNELELAFKKIYDKNGICFGFIAFDACLMANLETIYAVGNYADYIVASEESMPACGFDYKSFFKNERYALNSHDEAKLLAKLYFKSTHDEYSFDYLSISVIDCNKAKDVFVKFDNAVENAKIGTEHIILFGGKSKEEGYSDMADLLSIFENQSSEEVQELIDSVNNAVVYCKNGVGNFGSCGISVYYPYYVKEENKLNLYSRNAFCEKYVEVLVESTNDKSKVKQSSAHLNVDGNVYECACCSKALLNEYYSVCIGSYNGYSVCYRIKKNYITEEVKVDSVILKEEDSIYQTEQKYFSYDKIELVLP